MAQRYSAAVPDAWVKRSESLIPLTGPHPFNAEPAATLLLDKGFITPNDIHYVRNHAAVPKLDRTSHKLVVGGLVGQPRVWNVDELERLPAISVAVTMSCDGNRRKEVNTIERGRGFDWGPAAVGTAVWTGVPLYQLLRMCGEIDPKARFVQFEGADTLPKGKYGTSIPLYRATDPLNEIIVAYRMNGEPLPPDHGFPIRMVLPGFVGGRSVKWLSKITVSEHESQSSYHWHDNKVLPPWITPDVADSSPIWKKPEYTLYDLNVNSVIVYPEHEQWIDDPLSKNNADALKVRGYAYCGGGRRITRVELTMDNGATWMPADVSYPPEGTDRANKRAWTWCHWQTSIPAWKLLRVNEIAVRAFDEGHNTQPENITWNVLGMMNNSWYRVRIDVEETNSGPRVTFQHPVLPGLNEGGWRVAPPQFKRKIEWSTKMPLALPTGSVAAAQTGRQFSRAEVAKHNKIDDCWIIIEQQVIDITPYVRSHPGGPDSLHLFAGRDATELFTSVHAHDAYAIKDMYIIGTIVGNDEKEMIPIKAPERALDARYWLRARLIRRTDEASDVRRFVFQLERDGANATTVGLPPGLHVLLGLDIDGDFVVRPYTPTRPVRKEEDDGTLEFVIRIYEHGKLTPHLDQLKVGDHVAVKGPMGAITYLGRSVFTVHNCSRLVEKVSMVAGGTGITPLYQVMRAGVLDPEDKTQFYLIYANRSIDQILLRKELEELAKVAPDRVKLWFTVGDAPKDGVVWPYDVGRITEEMMRQHLAYPPTKEVLSLFCGPPIMIDDAAIPYMEKIGYVEQQAEEF